MTIEAPPVIDRPIGPRQLRVNLSWVAHTVELAWLALDQAHARRALWGDHLSADAYAEVAAGLTNNQAAAIESWSLDPDGDDAEPILGPKVYA